ncbi:MAG: GIY-YIG nuclease family protein [Candidatus Omnitrophica bacterium]|nr:GIY-YIG nuclease family protein [Candidatus Omnitrophota bacterium]
MHYVYLLRDKRNKSLYIGYSDNIEQRVKQHQSRNKNLALIYYEAYIIEQEARTRERKLKVFGSAYRGLKQRLSISLNNSA